jgi:thymidylate kinase
MYEQLHPQEYQEQQALLEQLCAPQPTVIGVEGGPCSGKTTLINRLSELATDQDRTVVLLPEAATPHIEKLTASGRSISELAVHDRPAYLAFEADVLRTIVDSIEEAKRLHANTNAIIVADRVDIGAYLSEAEYVAVLAMIGLDTIPMLGIVDQLYYLPTVARENSQRYEELKRTNPARYETSEEAVATCQANLAAVSRHPELHIGWTGPGQVFEDTIAHAVSMILSPEVEAEVKLTETAHGRGRVLDLVRTARNERTLISQNDIEQAYYELQEMTYRLRRLTTVHNETLHTFTIKSGEGITRSEVQRRITPEQFACLSAVPQVGALLRKTRYSFLHVDDAERTRIMHADWYNDVLRWDIETDVTDSSEAEAVTATLARTHGLERAQMSAQRLARMLGASGLTHFSVG